MKTLVSAAALALAAFALWRLRRGRRTVLAGRFATNAVRAAALLLFLIEARAGAKEAAPSPSPVPSDGLTRIGSPKPSGTPSPASFGGVLPVLLAGEGLRRWARRHDDPDLREVIKMLAAWEAERDVERKTSLAKSVLEYGHYLPDELRELVSSQLNGDGSPVPPARALAALDAAETAGVWQSSVAAWLWRRTAAPVDATELPALYARIETHLRAVDTLTKTTATTGPVRHTPWMSKAMPPPGHQGRVDVPADFESTAAKLFPETPPGTWETDAVLGLTVVEGAKPATLHRRGMKTSVAAKDFVRLRRLDVLEAHSAIVVEHPVLGKVAVPAGTRLTVWTLPALLPPATVAKLDADAALAREGNAAALKRLEAVLPAAHPAIRTALASKPTAPGAAALRQLLTSFDD